MAKKTRAEAIVTRDSILAAAIEVFQAKGVAAASLEEIAERASVTRGAIYWHFKNKIDIFEALHEQLHQSVIEIILGDLETDHPHPLQQLEELCVKLLTDLQTDQKKRKLLRLFIMNDYTGEMRVFILRQNKKKARSIELFSRYFDRAISKAHISGKTDSRILALSLHFFLTGIIYEHLRDPGFFDMEKLGPELVRQFFRGFSAPA